MSTHIFIKGKLRVKAIRGNSQGVNKIRRLKSMKENTFIGVGFQKRVREGVRKRRHPQRGVRKLLPI